MNMNHRTSKLQAYTKRAKVRSFLRHTVIRIDKSLGAHFRTATPD